MTAPSAEDTWALEERFGDADRAAQDWTGSVRHLCDTCGRGSLPADHAGAPWVPHRHVGLAAAPEEAQHLLRDWVSEAPGRSAGDPVEVER